MVNPTDRAGIAGAVASVLTVFVLGAMTPGHDWVHGYISSLSERGAPHRELYVAGGTIAAACHLVFVAGLWRRGPETALHAAALTSLGLFFALHWIAAAFLPCDADCAWLTATGRLHYAFGLSAFVAVGLGVILYSIHGHVAQTGTRAIHALAAGFVATALALLAADRTGQFHGVLERLSVVVFAAWVITVATAKQPSSPPAGARATIRSA